MYLMDSRYATLAAFVEGYNQATGGSLLDGFAEWLAIEVLGEPSSLHWATLITHDRSAGLGRRGASLTDLDQEEEELLITTLMRRIDEFLAQ